MSFGIRTLHEADCLSLVKVHYRAFNRAAGTYFFSQEPSEDSYKTLAKLRAAWIARPNVTAYQAVDSNGAMIGAAVFHIQEAEAAIGQNSTPAAPTPMMTEFVPEQNARLWRDFGKIMQEQYAKYVGTKPAVEVLILLVEPDWQGKGVGSALLDIGVKEADRIGCITYVEASDEGLRVYEKAGFEKVGSIGFDASAYSDTTLKFPVDTVMIRRARTS